MRHIIALWALALVACSASDPMMVRQDQGRGPAPISMAGRGSSGPSGSGIPGGGAAGFGNDQPGLAPVIPLEMAGAGGMMSIDGGPCQVGQFCGPQGPDPDNCGTLRLEQDVKVTRHPGNLLVIFDQSVSMSEPWNGTTKIVAAQDAVAKAITSLQDLLTVGAIFFPTLGCIPALPSVAVDPIDTANQISFRPGKDFLTAWNQHWTMLNGLLGVGTPMQEAFDRADAAIAGAKLTGPLAVMVFTDGAPNCIPDDTMTMIPTMVEPDRAAGWLSTKMVKTYMVGLPGAGGVQLLNDVAVKGGTMQYIVPDDPAALEAKLREVVSETVKMGFDSCMISLKPAADPVDKLLMIVEEGGKRQRVEHTFGANGGWTISADGLNVELTGTLCEDAKSGRFASITFEYGCKDVPPPPPLPGPT
ncbi:MAG TPA: vWA domain-containing protein [Polyangiales bacterium]|nr:vWA domain-containing protein [Polyangiales bacterium]